LLVQLCGPLRKTLRLFAFMVLSWVKGHRSGKALNAKSRKVFRKGPLRLGICQKARGRGRSEMKLALIGNGAMGQLVSTQARAAGAEIGVNLTSQDASRSVEELASLIRGHDAAIDFSVGVAVVKSVEACARAGVPLVEGTTGWKDQEAEVRRIVAEQDAALVYGANFSIGVNVFYRIVEHASELIGRLDQYQPFIEEEHHARKRDAPSGTALKLKALMSEHIKSEIPIASVRAGHIPGTHRVGLDSAADQIMLTHTARSREGFAGGALLAAGWIIGRKGVFEFSDMLDEIVNGIMNDAHIRGGLGSL
jgi:4-hydroxy-tetrahydrodipicolinate reductase